MLGGIFHLGDPSISALKVQLLTIELLSYYQMTQITGQTTIGTM